jgi:hypothetical protein
MPVGCRWAFAGNFGPRQSERVQGGVTILVKHCVVRLVFAAAHAREPLAVSPVPFNRLAQPLFEGDNGIPAEFCFNFPAVQGVAAIVAWAVLNIGDQTFRPAHDKQQTLGHAQVFFDFETTDVIDLTDAPASENRQNGMAMIFDMLPIALLLSMAIDREGLTILSIRHHRGRNFSGN